MALQRESTRSLIGYLAGDVKIANYDITFTAAQLVEPTNDPGWFLLNGAVISQTTYPVLFARFGTTFNTGGEGTGNFRLPNYTEGITAIGKGVTTFPTYAATGGEITHLLTAAELPAHTHGSAPGSGLSVAAQSHSHTASASAVSATHTHSYNKPQVAKDPTTGSLSGGFSLTTGSTQSGGAAHTHTASISGSNGANQSESATESFTKAGAVSATAVGSAHNNMMPYIVIGGYLVKYG